MVARLLTLLVLALVVYVPAARSTSAAAPTGVHTFLLRTDEPPQDKYAQTPSFAWHPYDGATSYDFELATSKRFDDRTLVWSTDELTQPLRVPAIALPLALPWMTGTKYALFARVRAHLAKGVTPWSAPFGFNTEGAAPERLPDIPGLVRWKPVEGATSYEVWFVNVVVNGIPGKVISTTTNAADEREYYTGHQGPSWTGTVQWRVRAVRKVYGALPNALPAVSYGPWSDLFVSSNPPVSTGTLLTPTQTVSNVLTTDSGTIAHNLTPGFAFTGDTAGNGMSGRLYRVYVATDSRCVNVVFTGSVVGSPAYAPRTSGPIELPPSDADTAIYPPDGAQAGTFSAESLPVTTNEQLTASTGSATTATGTTDSAAGGAASAIPADFTSTGPFVDLWDLGRPNARFWWTVVPVRVVPGTSPRYQDAESPQDACEARRVMEFVRTGAPTTTSVTRPYASGLSAFGELVAARARVPSFYRAALVAWKPTMGATGYEVQWSKTRNPWRPASAAPVYTAATSMLLEGLSPGTWYYRVRGIDPYVPGPVKQMSWSAPVQIKLVRPKFVVESGVTTRPNTK
jgi:hypothetical protein